MRFYFIRHGETDANRQLVLAGAGMDHPLNEEGHRQAQELAQGWLDRVGESIGGLFTSPMSRAHQTARALGGVLGHTPRVHHDLREWHLGEWEGKPYAGYLPLLLGNESPTRGETRQDFYRRVFSAWQQIHRAALAGEVLIPYAIVSHGAVWLALQDQLGLARSKIGNCEVVRVQGEGDDLESLTWRTQIL
jgi:broad specificity phosphatase PhoE